MSEEIKKINPEELEKISGGLFGYDCPYCGNFGVDEISSKARLAPDGKYDWEMIYLCPKCKGKFVLKYP